MFPMDKIKKEVCDENSEMDSKEFKIEVKMEDIDPSDVPNIDNNFSNAGCVKTETDFEALFVKDEFEREIVEQQLQNNDETINVPVLLDGSEVKPNLPSKKLVVLPKKVYMDMKSKKKTEVITPNLPGPSNSICGAALDAVLSEPGPTCVNKNRRIFSHQRMKAYEVFVAYKKTGLSKSRSVAMTAADMGFSKVTMWRCIKEMETTRVQSPSKQVVTPSLPGPSNSICGAALDAVLSEPCPTSINKNRRGKLIFSDQRMKAYEVFVAYKKTGLSKSRSVAMTAADMGFSENTVWRCVKEMETTGKVQSPSSKRKRRQLFHKLDEKQRETLRQITDSFLERKERPSLNKINREIKKRALSQYMAEREALTREKAVLSTEVGLLKGKVSRGRRAISNFKKQVTLLENRIRYSDEKVKDANMESRRLQDRIDELQTHVCLLSANNSELKQQLENLQVKRGLKRKKSEIITEPNNDRERVENNSKMLTDDGKPSMEVLKQTIISLVKEKNFIEVQLDKKTGELKMTQEKYGKTIMSLSAERRKTEELMKKLDTNEEKKKHSPMVWAFRK